ncbi:MAG: DedA family protein [Sphingopyxis sp.]
MTDWIVQSIAYGGYGGIFLLMVLENIFPPIPSELIMGLGGIAVAQGEMQFWALLLAGTVGSTVGNYAWYLVGRRLGYAQLKPIVDRYGRWLTLDWTDVEAMADFFQRHGHWIVFTVRFMPMMRTMISLPAGLARMGRVSFLIYTALGTSIWNGLLIGGGYFLGTHFQTELDRFLGPIVIGSAITIGVAYVWRILRWQPRA